MRRLLPTTVLLLTAALLAGAAQASSPAAWSAHDKEVAAACVKASGLKDAKPAGQPMAYDDGVGMTALLVAGHYPQPHMKNRAGRVLCLFDRKKREAVVTEADQITLAPVAATSKAKK
ncbi:hypothetical protein [Polaromonas sp. YR568]|uniref:hypothetical protein n=1 Tax=Polaromonas sp. YR568 TaxID=1855301 RepID=UPI00398BD27B